MNNDTIVEGYLDRLKIKHLNKMQQESLQAIEKNKEIVLLSATGSGKTLTFLLPLIKSISPDSRMVQALILVPSRELALQIESVIRQMQTGHKITVCYGGHKREIEENNLVQPPAILIATPGRMADHIRRDNVSLKETKFLVLDEFDKSLELGFTEEMQFILQTLSAVEKKILTSATYALEIPDYVKMQAAVTLNFLPTHPEASEKLRIQTILSPDKDKLATLFELVCFVKNTSTIIFCNHRESVERTSKYLSEQGIVNVFYHGGMEQRDREVALCKFRNSSSDILVTTDLASRGLDIADIRNIVHYHLPNDEGTFTHRNGRTARMDATGNVYLIYSEDEKLPEYITEFATSFVMPEKLTLPEKPKWSTLFISAGKKDKINKIDIVGFLSNVAHLKRDEVGLIEVKDFFSFAAVRKSKIGNVVELAKNEKMKKKQVQVTVAK